MLQSPAVSPRLLPPVLNDNTEVPPAELVTAIRQGDAAAQESAIAKILDGQALDDDILTALQDCDPCINAAKQEEMLRDKSEKDLQALQKNPDIAGLLKKFFVAIPSLQEPNVVADVSGEESVQNYQMVSGALVGDTFSMTNDAYRTAIRDGFFEVEIPASLKPHIEVLDLFVQEFYKDKTNDGSSLDVYRGFNQAFNRDHPEYDPSPVEGYMLDNEKPKAIVQDKKRENQVERFSLAKTPTGNHWEHYPHDVQVALQEMNTVGVKILQFVLGKLGLPEALYGLATGGAAVDNGDHFGLFNHFDPAVDVRGLKAHADWSNVTVLRSSQPGLSAYIDGKWQDIRPSSDNHFIINFGTTLELLTAKLPPDERIKACVHQVFQQTVERTSYPVFLDHSLMAPVVECRDLEDGRKLVVQQPSFLSYANEMTRKTYEGENTEWI